jgi:NSS family neurotransmitter:Na+ symporter
MSIHPKKLLQDQWSSKLAFVLAATGAAVGLGNIWRFPYIAGMYGGSAFVLLYITFVLLIGIPMMLSEFVIGRAGRSYPMESLKKIALENKHSRHWGLLGLWGALALILVLSFYSVVSGWSIAYLCKSLQGQFDQQSPATIQLIWSNFLANPSEMIFWHTLFMGMTMGVIMAGVQQGLERGTKLMMPLLYLILFILVLYATQIGDGKAAWHFLFDFHPEKINGQVVIAALGHAFFTLALGAGALVMYGAYIPRDVHLVNSVFIVVGLDVLVAVLSGMAIFPMVFAAHLTPSAGPGLMFEALPISFAQLAHGHVIGSLFFLLLLFAAWTSSINIAEPLIVMTMNQFNWTRRQAATLIGLIAWGLGLISVFSFNLLSKIKLLASQESVFDFITNFSTNILLPIGGIGFAVFAGYIMTCQQSRQQLDTSPLIHLLWRFCIRYLAPAGVACLLIAGFLMGEN